MKIAICTPHYGDVTSEYALSLAGLMGRTVQTRILFNGEEVTPNVKIFMKKSSILPTLRNMLVQDALDFDANYLLWIDADHAFPPDSLINLLIHNLPVVGVNYARRAIPTLPTAVTLDNELLWTTEEMAAKGEVTQVQSVGLGLCLMDMTIFGTLLARALAEGKANFWPLFAFEVIPGSPAARGEDVYFFDRLREAGIGIYVDHALSWSVRHMFQKQLSLADTLADKAAYLESIDCPP